MLCLEVRCNGNEERGTIAQGLRNRGACFAPVIWVVALTLAASLRISWPVALLSAALVRIRLAHFGAF